MDLQHIKQTIKTDESLEDICAIKVRAMGPDERSIFLTEAVDLIDRCQKLYLKIGDPAERRCIHFENWSTLMKLDIAMAQFIRKLRV